MVAPVFIQTRDNEELLPVMLSFSIVDDNNAPEWCRSLSTILKKHSVKATVFVTGRVADQHSECVTVFGSSIDIGSQTYSYVDLTSISDYTVQLEEVRRGKQAVDIAGNIDSRLFKAPYGATDENIYSLLSRSDILADFSYDRQYNKYHDGQFIRFNLTAYDGSAYPVDFFLTFTVTETPVLIGFDNSTPVEQIDDFVSRLKSGGIHFVNASEVTGLDLTLREGE